MVFHTYLKEKRGVILGFLGVIAIFLLVGILYQVDTGALVYAAVLSGVLVLIVFVIEFLKYNGRYKHLVQICKADRPDVEEFTEPYGVVEQEYQNIAMKLDDLRKQQHADARLSMKEMWEYYGMWIHQVKTPISVMNLLLQSMGEDYPEEKRVKELRAELFKTGQYVEMVLTYLRTEDISADLDFRTMSLDDCIRQTIRKHSGLFIMKKIQLDFYPTEEQILTDEKWLVFVLEQLVSNALKYTEPGGKITIEMTEAAGRKLLKIEDTGIGIQAEDIPRIFEKGFTGYNGRSSKKASGIGLYLSRRILDRLGYEIRIRSQVGSGTCVYLDLKLDETASAER